MSSKNAKSTVSDDTSSSSSTNRLTTIASVPTYMTESVVSSSSPLNLAAEPAWSFHVRSLIIIRNESGYGFTLSRYVVGGQNDALMNLLPLEADQPSDTDKVSSSDLHCLTYKLTSADI